MSDGEEEATVEKSTDELLSETDDLLSDLEGGDGSSGSGSDVSLDELESSGASRQAESSTSGSASASASTRSSSDERGFRKYFEPSSAGVAGVLVLAGALVGGIVPIPFVGALTKLLGVGAATFLHGAFAGERRYAETVVASSVVGLALAVLSNPVLTVSGIGVPVVAISTALTVVAALVGHYFGRDLRAGLTRDIGGGSGGGGSSGGDVPDW